MKSLPLWTIVGAEYWFGANSRTQSTLGGLNSTIVHNAWFQGDSPYLPAACPARFGGGASLLFFSLWSIIPYFDPNVNSNHARELTLNPIH